MQTKLFDLHTDLPTAMGIDNLSIAQNNFNSGIVCANAVYRGERSLQECLRIASEIVSGGCRVAFEDCCYSDFFAFENCVQKEKIPLLVKKLSSYNPLYLSLGWNYDNLFCGGCANNGNLTSYGEIFINCANLYKLAIDTAHCSKNSFYSILKKANKVLCSHTAFEWVYPHRRNIDQNQVKAILDKGGIIGVIAVGHFLSGIKGNCKNYKIAYYAHISEYIKLFGVNGLCIGSDFYGSNAPVFKDGDYSFMRELTDFLQKSGVNSGNIEKIFYKNALEFFNLH